MRSRADGCVRGSVLLLLLLIACGGDDSGAGPGVSPDGGLPVTTPDGGGLGDGGGTAADGGDVPDSPTDVGTSTSDEPFACTPVVAAAGPDPTYVLGGAMPDPQGGTVALGEYRAIKGTHSYVEATPGACNGITPPTVVPYRIELHVRPTHFLMRVMSSNTSGTWTTSANAFKTTQTCPDAKPESGIGYTANGNTFILYGAKQDYVSGGCHFYMQYELQKQ
jgi:hypothetical protein